MGADADKVSDHPVKAMVLRYAGSCACGARVAAGTPAGYDQAARQVVCPTCLPGRLRPQPTGDEYFATPIPPVVRGQAGASAQAEFERRATRREERVRTAYPHLGGLLLALNQDPQSTRAWQSGAYGEQQVGARLDGLQGDGVLTLHDRRIPGTRANIDHIAIGPGGVYVIDAKRRVNAAVSVVRSGFGARRVEKLVVRGRDETKLVVAMAGQVLAVLDALEQLPGQSAIPVTPVLTFVDATLPVFGTLEIAGVRILGMRKTTKLVRHPGPLTVSQRVGIQRQLAAALPAYRS